MSKINNAQVIRYAQGVNQFDNAPAIHEAPDFSSFVTQISENRSIAKGEKFICAPMSEGPHDNPEKYQGINSWRLKSHVLGRCFLPMDYDGFKNNDSYLAVCAYLSAYSCMIYTTSSHTPAKPRARAIIELSREVTRDEGVLVGEIFQSEMEKALGSDSITFDPSVYRGEQPCYTPLINAETFSHNGKALDVDLLLTKQVPSNRMEILAHLVPDNQSPIFQPALEGTRNPRVLTYVGRIRRSSHLSEDEIASLALAYNQKYCQPPLNEGEVLEICSRYAHQNIQTDMAAPDQWEEAAPRELPPKYPTPPKLDCELLPYTLANYVKSCALQMQVPPEMIATPLIISLGSLIGKKLAIQPKQNDSNWSEYPNLWGVAILPPAMLKSPALMAGTRFLQKLENESLLKFANQIQMWESDERVRKLEAHQNEKDAKTALNNKDREQAKRLLDANAEIKPPSRERFIIQDATPEARLDILTVNPNGCMLIRDELDGHISQLKRDGYESARAQELQFFDGKQDYANDRIKRGSSIAESPRMALFGNLQPAKIEKYLRELKNGGNDDGYIQRLLQLGIQPAIDSEYRLVDTHPNKEAEAQVAAIFQAANDLPLERHPLTKRIAPRVLKFDSEAQDIFNMQLTALETKLRSDQMRPLHAGHVGKYRGTLPKLALIIAFAENPAATVINANALNMAIALLSFYSQHARRIYAVENRSNTILAHELLKHIQRGTLKNEFNIRDDITRKGWEGLTIASEVEGGLGVLVKYGYIQEITVQTDGRPRKVFVIRPSVTPKKERERLEAA